MDFKRRLLRVLPIVGEIDRIISIKNNGLLETLKEECIEDNIIYKMGKKDGNYEGKKDGYIKASNEYEKKLLAQAENFKKEKQNLINTSISKDALMTEYEAYIDEQEKIIHNLSQEKIELLNKIKCTYSEISNL